MKHYYSIANFITGIVTNGYDYLFKGTGQTNECLYNQLILNLKGYNTEKELENIINGIRPANFPYNWSADIMRCIGTEFSYVVIEGEHSDEWNGGAIGFMKTAPWVKLISDWSTATTITAGVLDTIDYYTNYNFLSWSNPIGLPNIIMQNIKLSYESFEVKTALTVSGAGLGIGVAALIIVDIKDILNPFTYQIARLVEKYGVEIKDKLLHPKNIQVEIIADDIYIESLVDNSMGQIEKDEHLDYSVAMEIESAYTTIYDTDTFEG